MPLGTPTVRACDLTGCPQRQEAQRRACPPHPLTPVQPSRRGASKAALKGSSACPSTHPRHPCRHCPCSSQCDPCSHNDWRAARRDAGVARRGGARDAHPASSALAASCPLHAQLLALRLLRHRHLRGVDMLRDLRRVHHHSSVRYHGGFGENTWAKKVPRKRRTRGFSTQHLATVERGVLSSKSLRRVGRRCTREDGDRMSCSRYTRPC